jgi:5'-AMP-activated protein kinase beta subunit, interaction domain
MRTSPYLPTAVDFTNILVNYLEVSADDIPETGATSTSKAEDTSANLPEGVHPPQVIQGLEPGEQGKDAATKEALTVAPPAPKLYSNVIPQYLIDLDLAEDNPRYQRAADAVAMLPAPPTLPSIMGKVILNGQTPMKDDSSVLNIPNHVVLNHLGTSSIKNNVLAVMATTRYKRKVRQIYGVKT